MRSRLLVFGWLLPVLACGSTDGPLDPNPRVGTYALQTVDGATLPYTFPNAPEFELTAERFTLNADNTFTSRRDLRRTQGTQVTTEFSTNDGLYEVNGATLRLTFRSTLFIDMTFTGSDEITVDALGEVWVYRR